MGPLVYIDKYIYKIYICAASFGESGQAAGNSSGALVSAQDEPCVVHPKAKNCARAHGRAAAGRESPGAPTKAAVTSI